MKIKILELLSEVLNEVGDLSKIPPYDFTIKSTGGSFVVDGLQGSVNISKWPQSLNKKFKFPPVVEVGERPLYNIGYSIEEEGSQFIKTNYKTLIKILKTVSLILKHHMSKLDSENPIYTIFSEGKEGVGFEDHQKMLIYKEILSKNTPSGYRIGIAKYDLMDIKFIYISK
tara:strand:+ start:2294 stop:2806 length:513 start_codon:yes stop_codon:yes gene_type:complete